MLTRRSFMRTSMALSLVGSGGILSSGAATNPIFELRAGKIRKSLAGPGQPESELWVYNGTSPGPEIRVRQGDRVRVRFINDLDEPTSVHWHGIRIDNAMDGVSGLTQDPVPPGGRFDYDFVVPDAGTFWYHAHNMSWQQVTRGLYGPLIVEEKQKVFDLEHERTLMIDDWRLNREGALDVASLGSLMDWSHAGRLGNWLTVNGQSAPRFDLNAGESYRIRLINACNARVLQISPKAMNASVLAYDGFPLQKSNEPSPDIAYLAPAQRVDLLVNGSASGQAQLNDIGDFALQELSGGNALSMAIFRFTNPPSTMAQMATALPANRVEAPDLANALRVPLVMEGGAMGRMGDVTHQGKRMTRADIRRTKQVWALNGIANVADEPLFRVERGKSVVIKTENKTGWLHGMHVHGHHFQILSRQREDLPVMEWRDTFVIDRDEVVEIGFVANNPGKWLLHCHMLEHAAAGMTTWFEVT